VRAQAAVEEQGLAYIHQNHRKSADNHKYHQEDSHKLKCCKSHLEAMAAAERKY
jgi:hypothetical protein